MNHPLTSRFSPAAVSLVLFYSPAHAADHLIQAWDALASAERGEKPEANRAYAQRRLDCAKSESVALAVKPRDRKAYLCEVGELEAALGVAAVAA